MNGIAVVGMSGRFPGADSVEEFWENLRHGREGVTFFADREAGEGFVAAGGHLDGIDLFDAGFFGLSAREAEGMDPQHRLFLECAWQGLEDAGYDPGRYPGRIGVYGGAALSFYLSDIYTNAASLAGFDDYGLAIGNDKDHLTTRVAYKLNLRGPSMTVQTACSTSLVAVCVACQALLTGQCDMALAGGVAADAGTGQGYYYQPGGIFSPDGHCRVFDAAAQGTVASNGVGVVVLKRVADAVADRDHIHAVITGFGVNNDGARKVGYTAPSVVGQAEAIATAQAMAGVTPDQITYIEAHGTGTELGDPIEVAALDQVFRAAGDRGQFCAIGSVKSNIGHLDTAAGIASLIKTVLAAEHGLLPPSLHYRTPNPMIDFAHSAFYVNTELREWKPAGRRRAGVSSFGIGGTNAHVIVEETPEAPATEAAGPAKPYCLITLSARSGVALDRATDDLAAHLTAHPGVDLADAAYTSRVGRRPFAHRRAVAVERDDVDGAREILNARRPEHVVSGVCPDGEAAPVVFLFPGQGSQEAGATAELYPAEPVFRENLDRCCELLNPFLGLDLRELLHPPAGRREDAARELEQTARTQPALFAIEYSLARMWEEWGVRPAAMLGHSLGEYVAACLAGVLSLPDALRVVAERGKMMQRVDPGTMLALPLPQPSVRGYLGDRVSLAAVNGPASCVVSGPVDAMEELAAKLAADGVAFQQLRTSHAYHSATMRPVAEELVRLLRTVPLAPPRIPYLSNLTGTWITPAAATDPRYWGKHLLRTVRFQEQLDQIFAYADRSALLEVGPGRTLTNLARGHCDRRAGHLLVSSLGAIGPEMARLTRALGALWVHGAVEEPEGAYRHERRRRIPLPTYPFERESYWVDPRAPVAAGVETATETATDWFHRPIWRPAGPVEAAGAGGSWLILDDGSDLGSRIAARLRAAGASITTAPSLDVAGAIPDAIVHLRGIGSPSAEATFLDLADLARALDRRGTTGVRIEVVADALHNVVGDERVRPAQAALLGACRVIPQEHPNLSCRCVDIDPAADGALDLLVAELTAVDREPVVAHRRGRRWLPDFEAVRIDGDGPPLTETGGVYLVTGGLGRVGLAHCEHLASAAGVRLVITGRAELPERERWATMAASGATARRIRAIQRLEGLGAEVAYFAADAGDREAMRGVLRAARSRFGPINGVVHAAGDTDVYATVAEIDRAVVDRQFRGKVAGVDVLAGFLAEGDLLRPAEVGFVLLVSSVSAQLGGAGLAAYAAANCYLDAMAELQNRISAVPWITVNWDAWEPSTGAEAIRLILSRAPRQIVVAAGLRERFDEWVRGRAGAPLAATAAPVDLHSRPDLITAYQSARSADEDALLAIWQTLLGVAPVGVHDDFFDLGGHSLLAVQLISRIRREMDVECRVQDVFDARTVARLAEVIATQRAGVETGRAEALLAAVEQLSEDEVRALLERDRDRPRTARDP
jgi:acyl transferase domain-containing protein/acyl carrier protein